MERLSGETILWPGYVTGLDKSYRAVRRGAALQRCEPKRGMYVDDRSNPSLPSEWQLCRCRAACAAGQRRQCRHPLLSGEWALCCIVVHSARVQSDRESARHPHSAPACLHNDSTHTACTRMHALAARCSSLRCRCRGQLRMCSRSATAYIDARLKAHAASSAAGAVVHHTLHTLAHADKC
jgi:hypothetical protein